VTHGQNCRRTLLAVVLADDNVQQQGALTANTSKQSTVKRIFFITSSAISVIMKENFICFLFHFMPQLVR